MHDTECSYTDQDGIIKQRKTQAPGEGSCRVLSRAQSFSSTNKICLNQNSDSSQNTTHHHHVILADEVASEYFHEIRQTTTLSEGGFSVMSKNPADNSGVQMSTLLYSADILQKY